MPATVEIKQVITAGRILLYNKITFERAKGIFHIFYLCDDLFGVAERFSRGFVNDSAVTPGIFNRQFNIAAPSRETERCRL